MAQDLHADTIDVVHESISQTSTVSMGSIPGYHTGDDPTEKSDDAKWNSMGELFFIDRGMTN